MIKHLCQAFLTAAARRWPEDVREEMLVEWRAELHAMPGTARRLRFAASLATSRPHREPAVVVRPGRKFAHTVLSLVLVAVVPMLYAQLSLKWTTFYDEYSIVWQAWAGVGGMRTSWSGAIGRGRRACSRMVPLGTWLGLPRAEAGAPARGSTVLSPVLVVTLVL